MKNPILFLAFLILFSVSCSEDDEEPQMADPLTLSAINAFVSTGSGTFQVTDLIASNPTSDIQLTFAIYCHILEAGAR